MNLFGLGCATFTQNYAEQLGLSCFCLRFGWVLPRNSNQIRPDLDLLDIVLTYEDLVRLMVPV